MTPTIENPTFLLFVQDMYIFMSHSFLTHYYSLLIKLKFKYSVIINFEAGNF